MLNRRFDYDAGAVKKNDDALLGAPLSDGRFKDPDEPVTFRTRNEDEKYNNSCFTALWVALLLLGAAAIILAILAFWYPVAPTPAPTVSPTLAPTAAPTPAPQDVTVPGNVAVDGEITGYHRDPGVGLNVSGMLCLMHTNGAGNGYAVYTTRMVNAETGLFSSHAIQPSIGATDNGRFKFSRARTPNKVASIVGNDYVNAHLMEHDYTTGLTTHYQLTTNPTSDAPLWWDEPTGFYYYVTRGDFGSVGSDYLYRIDDIMTGTVTDLTTTNGVSGTPQDQSKYGMIALGDYFFVLLGTSTPNLGMWVYNRTSYDFVDDVTRNATYTFTGATHPMFTYGPDELTFGGMTYDPVASRVYFLIWQNGPSRFRWLGYIQGTEQEMAQELLSGNWAVTLTQFPMSQACGDIEMLL